jgi:hypothetical protein
MKILAIKQPWASLIVHGHKDVENRTWRTRYRGPLLVHASLRGDDTGMDDIENWYGVRLRGKLPAGGIVGITEVVDCVGSYESKWYQRGHYAFVLANSRPLPFVKWKGTLSLRDAPIELLRMLELDSSVMERAEASSALVA